MSEPAEEARIEAKLAKLYAYHEETEALKPDHPVEKVRRVSKKPGPRLIVEKKQVNAE